MTNTVAPSVLGILLALAMGTAPLLAGCSSAGGGGDVAVSQDASEEQPAQQTEGEASEPQGRTDGDPALDTWADECTDRRGDVTAYAVAELTGGQLEVLLRQQDYAWSERNQMWVKQDGSAALVVNDANGEHLASEKIGQLGTGATEPATTYRIVTSGYSNAKKAFEGLAGKLMTCEDSEITDAGAIGVVSGPSGKRCLVFVNKSNDVYLVSVFSEPAVEAGLFDAQLGTSCGTTINAAFKALTGRTLSTPETQ